MKSKRDLALLAILVACGLRRHEAVELNVSDLQLRDDAGRFVGSQLPLNRYRLIA